MKLEAVIICVNYSDFLAHTLPQNKQFFDKLVVVTDTKDTKTKQLCDYYNVFCIQTDVFYNGGSPFNKGMGINEGLKCLDKDGWVLHIDADIYLPPLTREILEKINLNPICLYGIDRMMCPTYEEWIKFKENPTPTHTAHVFVHPTIFPMGVRICDYTTNQGYHPIGYFQLWNPKGSGIFNYPIEHGRADRTDVLFSKNWTRENRVLIPELICIHLESEDLNLKEMGKNWSGRKTTIFSKNAEPIIIKTKPIRGYKSDMFRHLCILIGRIFDKK